MSVTRTPERHAFIGTADAWRVPSAVVTPRRIFIGATLTTWPRASRGLMDRQRSPIWSERGAAILSSHCHADRSIGWVGQEHKY